MDFNDYTIGGETCEKSRISERIFRIEIYLYSKYLVDKDTGYGRVKPRERTSYCKVENIGT